MFKNDDNTMQLTIGETYRDGVTYYEVWVQGLGTRTITNIHTTEQLENMDIDVAELNLLMQKAREFYAV